MRIACPFCSAAYDVPAPLLREPRMVRCAQCSREWLVGPVSGEPSRPAPKAAVGEPPAQNASGGTKIPPVETATIVAEPPPVTARPRAEPARATFYTPDPAMYRGSVIGPPITESDAPRSNAPVWIAWAASIAVLLLLAWAAYTWRSAVMEAWPPSQRLYAAVGLKSAAE